MIRFGNPILLGACSLLIGCATISPFDQAAYEHATNAKVDTLVLMDKATTPYDGHVGEIEALRLTLAKAYEYDRGRPLNRYTIGLWDTLRGPEGVLERFLKRWEDAGRMSAVFIEDKKEHIGREFDDIIQLESGKRRTAQGAGGSSG